VRVSPKVGPASRVCVLDCLPVLRACQLAFGQKVQNGAMDKSTCKAPKEQYIDANNILQNLDWGALRRYPLAATQ
jgi:hypothetical protein